MPCRDRCFVFKAVSKDDQHGDETVPGEKGKDDQEHDRRHRDENDEVLSDPDLRLSAAGFELLFQSTYPRGPCIAHATLEGENELHE